MFLFGSIVLCFPQTAVFQLVGQKLLLDEVPGIIVRILIIVSITQLFHQFGRCIAQVQGYGQIAGLAYKFQGIVDGHVGGVTLRACGEVNGGFRQRDASFGPTHFHYGVETRIGNQQGVRVCQSHVFRSGNDEAAGDECGIFSGFHHAGQPIDGTVGITATDGLDEGGNDIIMHLSVFVVGKRILLQAFCHHLIGDDDGISGFGRNNEIQDVEQFAGVSTTVAKHGGGFF